MNAVRLIFDEPPLAIPLPKEFLARRVEVITMDVDHETASLPRRMAADLSSFAGKWQGPAMIRESEGDYEVRRGIE